MRYNNQHIEKLEQEGIFFSWKVLQVNQVPGIDFERDVEKYTSATMKMAMTME